jgi:hypothetical protein
MVVPGTRNNKLDATKLQERFADYFINPDRHVRSSYFNKNGV